MKEYQEKCPLLVVGGTAGSFLGSIRLRATLWYWGCVPRRTNRWGIFAAWVCTAGGFIFDPAVLRRTCPNGCCCMLTDEEDLDFLRPVLARFSKLFEESMEEIEALPFYRITPDSRNPYKQLYVSN